MVIVSEEACGQHNRGRSQGPLGGCVVSGAERAAWVRARLRNENALRRDLHWDRVQALAKGRRTGLTARLKPYWGKPTVRNFRGGRGNEVNGLVTVCHNARKGCHIGSHRPNHVRASALLDQRRRLCSLLPFQKLRCADLTPKFFRRFISLSTLLS